MSHSKNSKNFVFGILAILLSLNFLAWLAVYDLSQPQLLEVIFFDVGQGDAIFIETPNRHQILIDGGPDETILEKLAQEMPFWDRTIDLIILTHPDADHLAGLIEILKRYKVENILWTGIVKNTPLYKEWLKLIKSEKATVFVAKANQKISCLSPDLGRCYLKLLWPEEDLKGKIVKNDDNTSIVAKLVFGQVSFLFTGDIYQSVEEKLLEKDINSDILKVAHHGSKTSTSKIFLEIVSPEIAIIQVGKNNPYGHPHLQTLQNLKGIKILRTDLNKDIKIITDGIGYKIK